MPHYHFVGIGGWGMSAVARVLLAKGYLVSGSDLKWNETLDRLVGVGAVVYLGHNGSNVGRPDYLVLSTAIPEDNPEVIVARKRNIPLLHRSEVLAMLLEGKRGVAISGSHGKTTTTSMIASVLEKADLRPTVLIGGEASDFGANAKVDTGDYVVVEADESDGSFVRLRPEIAVVTNIEDDHLDYYGSFEQMQNAFALFMENVGQEGMVVACLDDPAIQEILAKIDVPVTTYSLEEKEGDYRAVDIRRNSSGINFTVLMRDGRRYPVNLKVKGKHNVLNALAAIAVGELLGVSLETIVTALGSFAGVKRRGQVLGYLDGIKVIDDYAHHPTEIKATLQSLEGEGRLVAVFQPHRYTRTELLYKEFGKSFEVADVVIVTEIYGAGEKPITGVSGELIVAALKECFPDKEIHFATTLDSALDRVYSLLQQGDILVTMGAGDIYLLGQRFLRVKASQTGGK